MRIALLEDEREQADLLRLWLSEAGHDCDVYAQGREFLRAVQRESYDVLVLDWMVPDLPGDRVLRELRDNQRNTTPVVFVTGRNQESDIVQMLSAGADDYMCKPVSRAETLARIAAVDRRARAHLESDPVLRVGPFEIDAAARRVARDGEPVELTRMEFELAVFLFRNLGRLLSRGHVLQSVWGTSPDLNTRTVDTHVSRLRNKLGLGPDSGVRLTAVYQHGYRLERCTPVGEER